MLDRVATVLKAIDLFAHYAHNNCVGATFFQDHEFFGAVYPAADSDYDSVVERMIGSQTEPVNTIQITAEACKTAETLDKSKLFGSLLKLELLLCIQIDKCIETKAYPEGTNQMLGDIADKSLVRQYKIKQRLKK